MPHTEMKQHTQHHDMAAEIQRLQLLEGCRKRAAEVPEKSLRRIFDTESRTVCWKCSCFDCRVGEIESSMYKRRSRLLPLLPTDASDVAARITGSR